MVSRRKSALQWSSAASRRLRELAGSVELIGDAVQVVVGRLMLDVSCPPTDLEALGRLVNVRRFVAEPLPVSGELRREDGGFVVAFSSYLSPGRRKFTIAHEIAHAIFETSGPNCPRSGEELERLCDMIATEILMPKDVFLKACNYPDVLSLAKVCELPKLFQTSLSATALRCVELLGVSILELDGGAVAWSYGAVRKAHAESPAADDLRAAIHNSQRRQEFDDRIYFSTERTGPMWWQFESKMLGKDRYLILLRALGKRPPEPEVIIPI